MLQRERKGKREKEMQKDHFFSSATTGARPGQTKDPEDFTRCSMKKARAQGFGSFPSVYPRPLAGS